MRNGFEGLIAATYKFFSISVIEGAFFVFVNKKNNLMKVLYWDIDGHAIWYKRLEKGRFLLRNISSKQIERKDFLMLLEGIVPKVLNKRYKR